ncbi:PBP1A family penicillin-binding protein [Alphaproteobacteria bacterium GH1-50]|uniref:Penicillin-binding protein 1A n=1 Tax=Kangsaoukella pontilimi TaxID=2691042 RepID=A0A7C9M963_9RHOB|nr:PBP1A family penicillin-binding protein [Kangsaoukella pontilimi]MXQ07053.1 PBP1A family penicillin-binding protein [Kangsaoukella pontilimi]
MTRFILSFFGAIFSLVTLGLIMAALTVGAVFWYYGRDLPDHESLAQYRPPTISRIYSTEGRIIDEYAEQRRIYAPADEIPDLVKNAFISAEDKNFYLHQGFDMRGIAAAVYEAVATRGESVRGASTIPQQVAKISFLSGERRIERKIKEVILATRMVNSLPRDKILEIYLNEIFLGQNAYGVAAAAQTYFNKNLSNLEPAEAAYLAALPKAPSTYHPVLEEERAIARRNFVLREMYENGYIDLAAYEHARVAPLLTVQSGDVDAFRESLPPRDYFTDEIRRQLSRDFGDEGFRSAGLTIRATADPELQEVAAEALREALEDYDRAAGEWRGTGVSLEADSLSGQTDGVDKWRIALEGTNVARDVEDWYPAVVLEVGDSAARIGVEGWLDGTDGHWITPDDLRWISGARRAGDILSVGDVIHVRHEGGSAADPVFSLRQVPEIQGAFMAMDVNNGRVLAMQGGFSYQDSVFNRATQATRQPGSSFKPFVYAAALDSGFTPATIIIDAPIEVDVGGGQIWRPKNASNQFYGPTPLRTGIERSRNLMTVRLAEEVGMQTVAGYAERFGVYDDMQPFLANALGSQETTLYRMVAAYAMFANGGERVTPTLVDRIQDRWGTTIYRHDQRRCEDCVTRELPAGELPDIQTNRQQVMNPITAYQLTSMMRGVVERGTASGTVNLPVPTAGKTGTTNDAKDVWFVGFTSTIAAGCYIGYDLPEPLGRGASGGGMCGPVFQKFMEKAVEKYGGGRFAIPPGGRFIKIDRFTGARLPDDVVGENVVAEYFREGEEPVFGITFDGGFAMGANLPLFTDEQLGRSTQTVETSSGETVVIPGQATAGEISSGGLY